MRFRYLMLCLCTLLTGTWSPIQAQNAGEDHPGAAQTSTVTQAPASAADSGDELQEVVVTGMRASLQSAINTKRTSQEIIDSIVAEDIGKLPDDNVAEALQRISGIQIGRDQGEGDTIAIRGMTQIRTELDGRSIFSAGSDRGLSFEDVPSELFAGIDVYKTQSANLIEGGIGGLINLKTHRPLDFDGLELSGSVRETDYDKADHETPQFSGLASDRWETGIGEIGALLDLSYQKTAYRSDEVEVGTPLAESALGAVAGLTGTSPYTIDVPSGGGLLYETGGRRRIGANTVLQWRPSDHLEFYAESNYSEFEDRENADAIYAFSETPVPNTYRVFPGTTHFESGTLTDSSVEPYSFISDTDSTIRQLAGGSRWTHGALLVTGDISYTKARTSTDFNSVNLDVPSATTIFQSFATPVPSLSLPGTNLTNPNLYTYAALSQDITTNEGSEMAARLDATVKFDGPWTALKLGLRYADRKASNASVSTSNYGIFGDPISTFPAGIALDPYRNFFAGGGAGNSQFASVFYDTPAGLLRNFNDIEQQFGQPTGQPAFSPLSIYDLDEKTLGGYLMAEFAERSWSVPVSGNLGLRVVSTQSGVSGYSQLDGGGTVPVETSSDYVDPLPSLNVTADLTDTLLLRLGLSKAMTRPSFSNLSPSVVLNTTFKTGTAGNPDLKPMYAKQADTSLEWYFQRNGLAYIDGFYKNVTGFIQTIAQEEAQYDNYLILMPRNGSKGIIKGFELGYQQFFGFLPAPLDGLGVQANYTYVYSAAPSPVTDQIVPLEGLSPHSYNVAAIYEKYGISARVAYNWRDTYVQTTAGPGTGALPIFDAGGGELDASISYSLNTHFTVVATAVNLTRLRDETYYGTPSLPFSQSITDRRFGLGVRGKW